MPCSANMISKRMIFGAFLFIIPFALVGYEISYSQLISNARSWNNCQIFPSFQNCARGEKDLKDNKYDSLHLGRKYARIFVLGQNYLFLETHSFPRATFSENCSLLMEQTMLADKYPSILISASNGGCCLFIIHRMFRLH